MPLVKCRECQKDVSDSAEKCPHCGTETPCRDKHFAKIDEEEKGFMATAICGCIVLLLIGGCTVRSWWRESQLPDPELVEKHYTVSISGNYVKAKILNKNKRSGLIEVTVRSLKDKSITSALMPEREWKQRYQIGGSQGILCTIPLDGDSIFNDEKYYAVDVKAVHPDE